MRRLSNIGLMKNSRYDSFSILCEDVEELKERVSKLELSLIRGLWLLTANLLGVIFSLVQQVVFNR